MSALILCAPSARAQTSWPDISSPPKAAGGGERDAAVIVGAEKYAFVEHVSGARQNASDWQAYLTGTLKVPAARVALLLDNDATNDAIRQAAVEKAAEVESGGTLWFVFIGHGSPSKNGKDGLLVGVDAQQKASSIYSRSLSRDDLLGILAKGKQEKTVVLLDACFSGKSPSGQALVPGLQPLIAMHALPPDIDGRMVLMTAARSDQFAGLLPGGSRPAFSYLALGGLRGWAADGQGRVTAAGLLDYIRGALSLARDRTQTPELSAPETSEVILGMGRETGPDLAKVQREAAASSGSGFQVTNLPVVPRTRAPEALESDAATGFDFRNLDIESLTKKSETVSLDQSDASSEEKAEAWRQLAKDVPQFAGKANERAAQWDAYALADQAAEAARQRRTEARDADWEKLAKLLALNEAVVPEVSKTSWSAEFLTAYMKSPGLEPVMAQELSAHVAAGPTQEALKKLALKGGIHWVRIPGGRFSMGSVNGREGPVHRVIIKSFQMAKTLTTNKQYKACVAAGACTAPKAYSGGDDSPVVNVNWDQAKAFALWTGGRLPSEAEWEYAARSAGKDWEYPWGNEQATCANAVIRGCGYNSPEPVCSKPAGNTTQGLCDMAGNAWEWVEDSYHGSYNGAPTDGSAWKEGNSTRVLRGGSWYSDAVRARSANRNYYYPDARNDALSFRVVR